MIGVIKAPVNIEVIAEHSVLPDLLSKGSKVLDIGCRGFDFTKEMYLRGCHIFSVDIDHLPECDLKGEDGNPLSYLRCAVSGFNGLCGVEAAHDPQATRINKSGTGTDCYTLKALSQLFGVEYWDLIKIDVEGSEYDIIMTLEEAPAKQLSIEFHLHTGSYGMDEMRMMEDKLQNLGYAAVKHEYSPMHGAGNNYWDSLFVRL